MLQALVTLVLFMIILFVATRAAGDPALLILPADATPEQIQMARERIGTDRSYVFANARRLTAVRVGDLVTQ